MKVINGIITFNKDDAPVLVDTLAFAHRAFFDAVTDPANVKAAAENPESKTKMLNSIKRMFVLDGILEDIRAQGGWPKDSKFAPMNVILRNSLPEEILKSPETFFECSLQVVYRNEQKKQDAEKKE